MTQIINIIQQSKRGLVKSKILRSSLKNYIFFGFNEKTNRNIWIKKTLYKKAISKYIRRPAKPKRQTGHTEIMGKGFMRFRFNMNRYKINETNLPKLFQKFYKNYKKVINQGSKFPTQRLGVSFAAEKKEYHTFINRETHRENKKELFDTLSTVTYENNIPSTPPMFNELYEKILRYIQGKSKSPTMLEEDNDKTIRYFYVIYSEQ